MIISDEKIIPVTSFSKSNIKLKIPNNAYEKEIDNMPSNVPDIHFNKNEFVLSAIRSDMI